MISRSAKYEVLNPNTGKWELIPENCRSSIYEYLYKDGLYMDLSCDDSGDIIPRLAPVREVA